MIKRKRNGGPKSVHRSDYTSENHARPRKVVGVRVATLESRDQTLAGAACESTARIVRGRSITRNGGVSVRNPCRSYAPKKDYHYSANHGKMKVVGSVTFVTKENPGNIFTSIKAGRMVTRFPVSLAAVWRKQDKHTVSRTMSSSKCSRIRTTNVKVVETNYHSGRADIALTMTIARARYAGFSVMHVI
jgi:hypothetical protein